MKGDFSRNTFNPKKHYRSVLKQQGRVDVDADWNEQQAINARRVETEAIDVIGGCGAPLHDAGFHIVANAKDLTAEEANLAGNQNPPTPKTGDFLISAGRYYVDGILCENEIIVPFTQQPDLPNAQPIQPPGFYLVYLDVWLRHLTALDDPLIREKALGGPDTATRLKTVWQVKVLPVQTSDISRRQPLQLKLAELRKQLELLSIKGRGPNNNQAKIKAIQAQIADLQKQLDKLSGVVPTCATDFPEWDDLIVPSSGTLNARTQPPDSAEQACLLPPSAGYQRLENQLYRVEVHQVNTDGSATFVWSRDNGTVVTAIKSISGSNVGVADVGPDDVLGFANGQWVEIIDDATELNGRPGQLLQVGNVDEATRTITLTTVPQAVDLNAHPKLRRWDQTGNTATPEGVAITFDKWQPLEAGIEIMFSRNDAQGTPLTYKTGDYWLIPARTATGEIEWPPFEIPNTNPIPQPPAGVEHHFCRLAIIEVDSSGVVTPKEDCRRRFPPLTELPTPPTAIHVEQVRIQNPRASLPNDSDVLVSAFANGIEIECDSAIDPEAIQPPAAFVILEVPEALQRQHFGFRPLILAGDFSILPDNTRMLWTPTAGAQTFLKQNLFPTSLSQPFLPLRSAKRQGPSTIVLDFSTTLDPTSAQALGNYSLAPTGTISASVVAGSATGSIITLTVSPVSPGQQPEKLTIANLQLNDGPNGTGGTFIGPFAVTLPLQERVLARLILKGNFLWGPQKDAGGSPTTYLDGTAFGKSVTPDRFRTELILKSGNGQKSHDFEMWFWLVADPNKPPTISSIKDQTTGAGVPVSATFEVNDEVTPAFELILSATSSNTVLVPIGGISFTTLDANRRSVTVTPSENQTGTTTITLTVVNKDGASASTSFKVSVTSRLATPFVRSPVTLFSESTGLATEPQPSTTETAIPAAKGPPPGTTALLSKFITENHQLIRHDLSTGQMTKDVFVRKYSGQPSDVGTPLQDLLAALPDQYVVTSGETLLNEIAQREAQALKASSGSAAVFTQAFGSATPPPGRIADLSLDKFISLSEAVRRALPTAKIRTVGDLASADSTALSRAETTLKRRGVKMKTGELFQFAGQAKVLIHLQ